MKEKLIKLVKTFPNTFGVYKFYSKGKVMYVGKSKNLRNRIMSYFNKSHNREKIYIMMEYIDNIEIITCNTHLEALVLEYELIKKYRPMYNSQYKKERGENFYIKLSKDKIFKINYKEGVGPFSSKIFIEKFITYMKNIYPLNYNKDDFNIEYNVIPKKLSKEDNKTTYESLLQIFSKEECMDEFIIILNKKMKLEASLLKFETASYYKEMIEYFTYLKELEFKKKVFKSSDYIIQIENFYYLISKGEIIYSNDKMDFNEFKDFSINYLKDFSSYKNIPNELKNIIYNECQTENVKVIKI